MYQVLAYAAILLVLVAGAAVGMLNLRSESRFEDFCSKMAALRGEQAELETDRTKNTEGYGLYREKIRKELVRPTASDFFPDELQSQATELGHYLVLTSQATTAFIVSLVVFGLYASLR